MYDYMAEAHGNWLALPHSDQAAKSALGERFGVRGIRKSFGVCECFWCLRSLVCSAMLVVLGVNGSVITKDGRGDVMQFGSVAFSSWQRGQSHGSGSSSGMGG